MSYKYTVLNEITWYISMPLDPKEGDCYFHRGIGEVYKYSNGNWMIIHGSFLSRSGRRMEKIKNYLNG